MTRVSTSAGWESALMNLMSAQQRQFDAQNRVSSTKIATDLGVSHTPVREALARLEQTGFVERHARTPRSGGGPAPGPLQ